MSIMLDDPDAIMAYHMLAQYHAAKLELLGMKHSSGRSIIAHIRKTYGLKGNKESVVEQFNQILIDKGIRQVAR
jgi:hypothetical protein